MKVEIIKFQNENARLRTRNDNPPFENLELWKKVDLEETPQPSYDPLLEKVSHDYSLINDKWVKVQNVEPLTQTEIDKLKEENNYYKLNWNDFTNQLTDDSNINSPYNQLLLWAEEAGGNRFNSIITQMVFVLLQKNEQKLRKILTNLKNRLGGNRSFTNDQLIEIDRLLTLLGVDWLWVDL